MMGSTPQTPLPPHPSEQPDGTNTKKNIYHTFTCIVFLKPSILLCRRQLSFRVFYFTADMRRLRALIETCHHMDAGTLKKRITL